MVLFTHIARLEDGLALAASVDEGESGQLVQQKQQIKQLVKKIDGRSEPLASIESGDYTIHYLIANGIIYMCICDRSYPRKLAFSYLEELDKEFSNTYGREALKTTLRPYAFVQFDNYMQKTKRIFQDTRAAEGLDKLNTELQDVQKIMTKNIEDLLYRGDSLDKMSDLSSNLRTESKKYRRAARRINIEAMIKQYIPYAGAFLIFVFLIWWIFLR